jgi:hypothetical protein
MKAELRAMIAYTAGCAISNNSFKFLFDQLQDKVIKFDGRFDHSYVTVIETESGFELNGSITGKELSLFHSVDRSNIKINLSGTRFTGTISDSKGFNGEVSDRIVKLYDYDEGKYFNFCLINEPGGSKNA